MKVAVSSNGDNLDAQLDPRFGRCAFFLVINPDDMSFEAFENDSAIQGGGGGIQSAQFLASKGVDVVLTGNCGPNAVQTLAAAKIKLFADQAGSVKEAVERFKQGNLKPTHEATVDIHFGMGAGAGPGGREIWEHGIENDHDQVRGTGAAGLKVSSWTGGSIQSKGQELEDLKLKAVRLNEKMKNVISRIKNLQKH